MNYAFSIACALIFVVNSVLLYNAVPNPICHYDLDSHGYQDIATHFLQTGKLSTPAGDIPVQSIGYPLLLSIIYRVAGQAIIPIIVVQVLLSLFCALLIFLITRHFFDTAIAQLALFFTVLNLGFLVYAQCILAELLLVSFLLLFIERFALYIKNLHTRTLVQAGFVLGCSMMVKPAAILYLCLLVPFTFFISCAGKKIVQPALLCLSFCIPVLCYMSYNRVTYNRFILAPTTQESIYLYFFEKVLQQAEGISKDEAVAKIAQLFGSTSRTDNTYLARPKILFFQYLQKHPLLFIRTWLANVCKTFFGLFSSQLKLLTNCEIRGDAPSFFKTNGSLTHRIFAYITGSTTSPVVKLIALLEALWQLIRYPFIFLALLNLYYYRRYKILFFFLSYIGYFSLITGHDGCARMRMPFEPVLIILAASGCVLLIKISTDLKSVKREPNNAKPKNSCSYSNV